MPIEIWLDERTDGQRRAAEAVLAAVRRHHGLVVEAVSVGILIKRERTRIELRPRKRWLDMSFVSTATIQSPRIARQLEMGERCRCRAAPVARRITASLRVRSSVGV
jgi:hypothetical protein